MADGAEAVVRDAVRVDELEELGDDGGGDAGVSVKVKLTLTVLLQVGMLEHCLKGAGRREGISTFTKATKLRMLQNYLEDIRPGREHEPVTRELFLPDHEEEV